MIHISDNEVPLTASERGAAPPPVTRAVRPDDNEVSVPARAPHATPADGGEALPQLPERPPAPAQPPSAIPFAPEPRPAMYSRLRPSARRMSGEGASTIHDSTIHDSTTPAWFRGLDIARALGLSKKTLKLRAEAGRWPTRKNGNRFEYVPPPEVAELLAEFRAAAIEVAQADLPVSFTSLAINSQARRKVLNRQAACDHYLTLVESHGVERSLVLTVAEFARRDPPFLFSAKRLRAWRDAYSVLGINGLVEQKQGRSGRKPAARHLTEELRRRLQAKAHEHGSIARGARVLMRDPSLPAGVREVLHEAHASKSYVTPSIREAARIAPLTADLAQGPKHARLRGPFTPCHYEDVKAGEYFVGDDMTSNILVWCEWPNARGYIIGQPQVLPVIDVGSLRALNVRCIMRSGGQYTSDDVWGLYGDVFDAHGLPQVGFVSEFGHWQGNRVKGHKTGLTDEERIGGLASLNLKLVKSFDPRTKIIETWFNQLQHVLDANPGYAGRDQRKQLPETIKRWRAECEAGHSHPRQHFMHLSQFADAVQAAMEQLNHERNDGRVCKGMSPLEKWTADDAPSRLTAIPNEARWLYRSAMSVAKVTRNGIRVTQGSGAKMLVYYYDNPAILTSRAGQKVTVYWNDHNPHADAIVLAGSPRKFIGSAQFVPAVSRFNASREQLDAEGARKKAAMHYARAELRTINPELSRNAKPVPADASAIRIGQQFAAAADKAEASARATAQANRLVKRAVAQASDADLEELSSPRTGTADPVSATMDELDELR